MTDQQQRTQWAIDQFTSFVDHFTAPALRGQLYGAAGAAEQVAKHIQAIAPKDDSKAVIGYGVFKREIDADWDIRQRPSGFVHELVSAVFDKLAHAENAYQGAYRRGAHNDQFIICEIREIP